MTDNIEYSGRQLFFESWLTEMPQQIGPRNDFPGMKIALEDFKQFYDEESLGNNLYAIEGLSTLYLFTRIPNTDSIASIVEFEKSPQVLTVRSASKDPALKGNPPYITDLYLAALAYTKDKSLKMASDNMITDQGFSIWKRLFDQGYTVSVYNIKDPNTTHKKITSIEELEQYFGVDVSNKNYRFTLSETDRKWFGQVREYFLLNRTRQLAGIYDLEEYFKNGGT